MSTVFALGPLVHHRYGEIPCLPTLFTKTPLTYSLNYPHRTPLSVAKFSYRRPVRTVGATEPDATTTLTQTHQSTHDVVFTHTFPVRRAEKVKSSYIISFYIESHVPTYIYFICVCK